MVFGNDVKSVVKFKFMIGVDTSVVASSVTLGASATGSGSAIAVDHGITASVLDVNLTRTIPEPPLPPSFVGAPSGVL